MEDGTFKRRFATRCACLAAPWAEAHVYRQPVAPQPGVRAGNLRFRKDQSRVASTPTRFKAGARWTGHASCYRLRLMRGERDAKKYELWHSESEGGHAFFCCEHNTARAQLEPDAKLVWTVDAISYADARRKLNEHMGWGPYEPAPEFARDVEENY